MFHLLPGYFNTVLMLFLQHIKDVSLPCPAVLGTHGNLAVILYQHFIFCPLVEIPVNLKSITWSAKFHCCPKCAATTTTGVNYNIPLIRKNLNQLFQQTYRLLCRVDAWIFPFGSFSQGIQSKIIFPSLLNFGNLSR